LVVNAKQLVNGQEVNSENEKPVDDGSNLGAVQRGNPDYHKRSTRIYLICSLYAKIDPPETVKIPFEKVGETDTLESVIHNKSGP
jgi:hypothetical protein